MPHHPTPTPASRVWAREGGQPHGPHTTRRRTLAAALAFLATAFTPRASRAASLATSLRQHLPPGLDPRALGAALRAAHPGCTAADCLARAALPNPADLPARSSADFAAGRTITVNGWVLSRTEAWLCAALA